MVLITTIDESKRQVGEPTAQGLEGIYSVGTAAEGLGRHMHRTM